MSGKPWRDDSGTTLLEVLIGSILCSLTAIAVLSMLGAAALGSATHRTNAQLGVLLQDFAETATYEIELAPVDNATVPPSPLFFECPTSSADANAVLSYYQQHVSFSYPTNYASGYHVGITAVAPYDTTTDAFENGCPTSGSQAAAGLQEITVVASAPGGQQASLSFVVRDPTFLQSDATAGL